MSIISEVMRFLTPQNVNRIAELLGIGGGSAGKMVAAAVPAIVGGLTKLSTSSAGLDKLSQVLGKEPANPLDFLEAVFTGKGQKAAASSGLGALENLLGNNTVGELAGALSSFGGTKAADSKSLLGMIAPAVLGTLANKQRAGLDMKGLANQLLAEKNEIARVMPEGFGDYLKGDLAKGIGLDLTADNLGAASRAASAAARAPAAAARSGMGRVWPLLIAAALALLAWYYFAGRGSVPEVATVPDNPIAAAFDSLKGIDVGGADLATTLGSAISGLRTTLAGITDEATAKSALPGLTNLSGQLEALANNADSIPASARSALSTALGSILPNIVELIDKVLAIPGVEAAIGPTLTGIRQHLEALARV
jgi:Bacterial protein of unknown function (DUF937)